MEERSRGCESSTSNVRTCRWLRIPSFRVCSCVFIDYSVHGFDCSGGRHFFNLQYSAFFCLGSFEPSQDAAERFIQAAAFSGSASDNEAWASYHSASFSITVEGSWDLLMTSSRAIMPASNFRIRLSSSVTIPNLAPV